MNIEKDNRESSLKVPMVQELLKLSDFSFVLLLEDEINTNSSLLLLTLKVMLTWLLELFQPSEETLFSGIKSISARLFPCKAFVSFILSTT